jgi:hypothetical protein
MIIKSRRKLIYKVNYSQVLVLGCFIFLLYPQSKSIARQKRKNSVPWLLSYRLHRAKETNRFIIEDVTGFFLQFCRFLPALKYDFLKYLLSLDNDREFKKQYLELLIPLFYLFYRYSFFFKPFIYITIIYLKISFLLKKIPLPSKVKWVVFYGNLKVLPLTISIYINFEWLSYYFTMRFALIFIHLFICAYQCFLYRDVFTAKLRYFIDHTLKITLSLIYLCLIGIFLNLFFPSGRFLLFSLALNIRLFASFVPIPPFVSFFLLFSTWKLGLWTFVAQPVLLLFLWNILRQSF